MCTDNVYFTHDFVKQPDHTSTETVDSNLSKDADFLAKNDSALSEISNTSKESENPSDEINALDTKEPKKFIPKNRKVFASDLSQENYSTFDKRSISHAAIEESDYDGSFSDDGKLHLEAKPFLCVSKDYSSKYEYIDSKPNTTFKTFVWTVAFSCLIVAMLYPFAQDLVSTISQDDRSRIERFRSDLREIRSDFRNQDNRLWKISEVSLGKNLKSEDNREPAVLMLASNGESYATTQCLARKLSKAFSALCNVTDILEVDGMRLKSWDGMSAKSEVDKILEKGFQNGACSATILRLESMPAYATTTFYQYCENDNAPFRNVAVIFTVQVENGEWNTDNHNLKNLPRNMWDTVVSEFLTSSLKTRDPGRMKAEMVSALLSRITPSVVWVKGEMLQHC